MDVGWIVKNGLTIVCHKSEEVSSTLLVEAAILHGGFVRVCVGVVCWARVPNLRVYEKLLLRWFFT